MTLQHSSSLLPPPTLLHNNTLLGLPQHFLLFLLSVSSVLHRSCSSFSGDLCHKWLHHFPCSIGAGKPIKLPPLCCVGESVCVCVCHAFPWGSVSVKSECVTVRACVHTYLCVHVSGRWPCIWNVSISRQSLAAELWSQMPSWSTWGWALNGETICQLTFPKTPLYASQNFQENVWATTVELTDRVGMNLE